MTVTQISLRNSRVQRHAAADAGTAAHHKKRPMDIFLSPHTSLSPREGWTTVGVACALLTAALFTGHTATPTQPDGADRLTQLQSNPELAGPALPATKEMDLAVDLRVSSR
jgi:hypothetical protein